MDLPRGTRIGPYEIIGLVGAGGMGAVYRGRDPRLDRDVAVKVLPPEFVSDADRLRRFEQEARAAAALNHPNVLAVYDVGTDGGVHYLVTEFLEGQTLRQALEAGPLAFRRVLDIARQVSSGLTAAHSRRIVHRDLKPENIFLLGDGQVKILDFGIAKLGPERPAAGHGETLAHTGTGAGVVLGTVGYMAPEQAAGREVDFRSDQFAFGLVVYEMLAGRRAFARDTQVEELAAIIRDEPPPLAEVRPEAPLPLQWLLNRCLAKQPAGRYESTRDLHRDLETLATHILPVNLGAPAGAPAASNLPTPRTPLIGREVEVEQARAIVLRDTARLVTFTGPGGIGKTRLALQVAHEVRERFEGGVFFAPLSSIGDAALVPQAIGDACGLRPTFDVPPADALRTHLAYLAASSPALLVLDSFEHLLDAVPLVVELLAIPVALKILVTSREPLHLYEEHEIQVPPLERPEVGRAASLATLAENAAVKLFVERARASRPTFALTGENAHAVSEICNRLDGLPLAIELAAARVKTLPPAAMLGRLQSRLQILTGGARDLPARQQTLRGAIAWSHDLLGEAEQRLFRRLSVFVGGCTFEAAEAVADTRQDLGVDILDGIDSLVNKSLLQLHEQDDGEARMLMMETIREFGGECLQASGEDHETRRAHAAYYLVLAEEAATGLDGPEQPVWVDRLDRALHNVRAALDFLQATASVDWGLRLASALLRYWELRELFTEGRQRLSALLALPPSPKGTAIRAKAVFVAGVLAASQRDYTNQRPLYEEAMRLYRELDDQRGMAVVRNALALFYKEQGDFDRAEQLFAETAASWLELGDGLMRARALSNLASVNRLQRRTELALERHAEALSLFREHADDAGVAWALRHQADIARDRRDTAQAEALYLQSHAAFEALGDAWSAGSLFVDLGTLALEQEDVETGLGRLRQAAEAFQQFGGHKRGLARVLEGLALTASLTGDPVRAICLAGAAAGLRTAIGTPLTPVEQRQVTSGLEKAHASLSPAARSQAWSRGWMMTVDEAVALGLNAGQNDREE